MLYRCATKGVYISLRCPVCEKSISSTEQANPHAAPALTIRLKSLRRGGAASCSMSVRCTGSMQRERRAH